MTVEAFPEPGQPSLLPGPLVRIPAGTELRLTIRDSLPTPLTFFVPSALRAASDRRATIDSLVVPSGAARTLATRADVPGDYAYRDVSQPRPGADGARCTPYPPGAGRAGGAARYAPAAVCRRA